MRGIAAQQGRTSSGRPQNRQQTILNHYANELNWRPEGRHMLLNREISGRWSYDS